MFIEPEELLEVVRFLVQLAPHACAQSDLGPAHRHNSAAADLDWYPRVLCAACIMEFASKC